MRFGGVIFKFYFINSSTCLGFKIVCTVDVRKDKATQTQVLWPLFLIEFCLFEFMMKISTKKTSGSIPTWDHCEKVAEGKDCRLKLKYIHCGNAYWGCISRMKNHLAGTHKDVAACKKCSNEVVELFMKLLDDRSKDANICVDDEDDVHFKRRNRLEQQRLNPLMFVKYSLRLEARHQRIVGDGDSYDPISLLDMESDDEWITEKESAVLPNDTTWMNANECFEVQG
ncbi:hypothetical protein F0562_019801 [Nyssa sinensis]|uniref:BED-type domain-containing protein n=1 Tax=Nyssa sinensis TaxID=561372 RepID=A0A5J5BTB2_9ASTE|nr:hypothetical protein F0562_019801 [Nyssa sinensis]